MAEVETNFSDLLRPFLKDAFLKMHPELDKRRRGRRIYNIDQLMQAASNRRSVFTPKSPVFKKPLPAAVIINMPGTIIHGLFHTRMYIYKPLAKRRTT